MEEEKKRKKNKKKNKKIKAIENNAIGTEESASSNQNNAGEKRGTDTHVDDTSGVDEDPIRHVTDGAKVSSLPENEKQCRMDTEASLEEKIKQLQKDKEAHVEKEAILEEKLKQLAKEKDASLLKEFDLEERIKQLQNENKTHINKEASFEGKFMQSQKDISSLMRQEANQKEKVKQLQMEKDVYLQKEAEFERKIIQLQSEKSSWLQKEAGFERRISELVNEQEKLNSKRVSLEEKIKEMEKERENRVLKEVSLEEKVKEMEKEREDRVQKEKSFREIISRLNGDIALLEAQVKEFEKLRTTVLQENQLLKENVQSLQTQVHNLEKSARLSSSPTQSKMNTLENGDLNSEVVAAQALVDKLVSEKAELVEKVNKLHVELQQRGPKVEVSSSAGSNIITRSSEAARVANESAHAPDMMLGAVQGIEVDNAAEPKFESNDAVLQSGERLQSLEIAIDKAERQDHEHVAKVDGSIVENSSEIESDEIVQIPLDENEVQAADLQADQNDEEVPLSNAPLIGAPFRLMSFVARYVSGADLVNKNQQTSGG